jgi:hypothetical protein
MYKVIVFDLKDYTASEWHKKCNEPLIPKNSLNSSKWKKELNSITIKQFQKENII